ncbi:MAG: TIGR04283 family arsenosugar biosynthesis glycosyltransferase [Croceivirga sp.]
MISVIIPVYDEVENLKKLLPRLGELSNGHHVEIIVSCGVCKADYSVCLSDLSGVKLLKGNRKGRAPQMNDGAAKAKGNILVFLHADVLPPKHFFEDILQTFSKGFDAGFFSYRFDRENFFLRINASFTKKKGVFTGGGDQCLFIKKPIFEKMGRFDEKQVLMEDFAFFEKMKRANIPYSIVHNDLVVSARKYSDNSYLRVNLVNLLLVILFKCKMAPKRLQKLHYRLLKVPR